MNSQRARRGLPCVAQMLLGYVQKGVGKASPWSYRIAWPDPNDMPFVTVFVQWEHGGAWEKYDLELREVFSGNPSPNQE